MIIDVIAGLDVLQEVGGRCYKFYNFSPQQTRRGIPPLNPSIAYKFHSKNNRISIFVVLYIKKADSRDGRSIEALFKHSPLLYLVQDLVFIIKCQSIIFFV